MVFFTAELQDSLQRLKESEERSVASATKLTVLAEYFNEREAELNKYVLYIK